MTPDCAEHGVDRRRGQPAAPDRVAERVGLRRPSRPHRHHRLAAGEAARHPAELARVPEAFQIEQHDLRLVVVLPELQQVVPRDVRPVAGRDERRDAEATAYGAGEDRPAERPALAEEADRRPTRHARRERGVERHLGIGVDDAQRVGPDDPHPVAPRASHELALPRDAVRPGLGVAARHHEHAGDPGGGAVVDHVQHAVGGHCDEREGDRLRHLGDGGVGRNSEHLLACLGGRLVHRRQATGEPALDHVPQQPVAERGRIAPGSHDHDGVGGDEPRHADRLRTVLAREPHRDRGVGRLDVEGQRHDTVIEMTSRVIAGLFESGEHAPVVGQHLGDEARDPALSGGDRQVLEHDRPESAALVVVAHHERHLGV